MVVEIGAQFGGGTEVWTQERRRNYLDAPWRNLKESVSLQVTETYLASGFPLEVCRVATGAEAGSGGFIRRCNYGQRRERGLEIKVVGRGHRVT